MTFPGWIAAGAVRLELHGPERAAEVADAINESLDHLSPWMVWAERPTTAQQQALRLALAVEQAKAGGDAVYSIVDGAGAVVGGCGLHRRGEEGSLDIGYWLHADHTGRGYATDAAAGLTRVAFEVAGASTVRITCDEANRRSAAVPERLGFVHVATEAGTMRWELDAHCWPESHGARVPVSYG